MWTVAWLLRSWDATDREVELPPLCRRPVSNDQSPNPDPQWSHHEALSVAVRGPDERRGPALEVPRDGPAVLVSSASEEEGKVPGWMVGVPEDVWWHVLEMMGRW